MPDIEPTLADLFALREPPPGVKASPEAEALSVKLVGIATKLTGFVAPPGAGTDMVDHLRSVVAPTIGTVLANGWNKRQEILKYGDTTKYPATKPNYIGLAPHDVKWKAVPSVRITINESIDHTLELTFEGKFHIEGAELKILGGRIMGMRTGRSWFEGKLTYGEKLDLIKKKSEDYVFPGEMKFGDGIPIPSPKVKTA